LERFVSTSLEAYPLAETLFDVGRRRKHPCFEFWIDGYRLSAFAPAACRKPVSHLSGEFDRRDIPAAATLIVEDYNRVRELTGKLP